MKDHSRWQIVEEFVHNFEEDKNFYILLFFMCISYFVELSSIKIKNVLILGHFSPN